MPILELGFGWLLARASTGSYVALDGYSGAYVEWVSVWLPLLETALPRSIFCIGRPACSWQDWVVWKATRPSIRLKRGPNVFSLAPLEARTWKTLMSAHARSRRVTFLPRIRLGIPEAPPKSQAPTSSVAAALDLHLIYTHDDRRAHQVILIISSLTMTFKVFASRRRPWVLAPATRTYTQTSPSDTHLLHARLSTSQQRTLRRAA